MGKHHKSNKGCGCKKIKKPQCKKTVCCYKACECKLLVTVHHPPKHGCKH